MLSVNVQNNIVALKDICQEQLGCILNWYNMTEDFRFATGVEVPVDLEDLEYRFLQKASGNLDFLLGIYSFFEDKIVGIITGKIAGSVLWVNMLAVGLEFQRKGYGSISVDLLLKHMAAFAGVRNAYLAVADKNVKGRGFWLRNGFNDTRQVCDKVTLDGTRYRVIIMQKRL